MLVKPIPPKEFVQRQISITLESQRELDDLEQTVCALDAFRSSMITNNQYITDEQLKFAIKVLDYLFEAAVGATNAT